MLSVWTAFARGAVLATGVPAATGAVLAGQVAGGDVLRVVGAEREVCGPADGGADSAGGMVLTGATCRSG